MRPARLSDVTSPHHRYFDPSLESDCAVADAPTSESVFRRGGSQSGRDERIEEASGLEALSDPLVLGARQVDERILAEDAHSDSGASGVNFGEPISAIWRVVRLLFGRRNGFGSVHRTRIVRKRCRAFGVRGRCLACRTMEVWDVRVNLTNTA